MGSACQWMILVKILFGILHLSYSIPNNDPYRWIISRGKPTIQSSTKGNHVASYATDGDFNYYDLPINYSQTTVSNHPYLQIDLGESYTVNGVQINLPVVLGMPKAYKKMKVTLGDDATIGSEANLVCCETNIYKNAKRVSCNGRGRYVTVQRMENDVHISFCELAVLKRPVENIAYMKGTAHSSQLSESYPSSAVVDMDEITFFSSNDDPTPWIRVDLGDSHLVHEVLIYARKSCCGKKKTHDIDIRIGDSLKENGNVNPFCVHDSIFGGEIKSFYCDMFGRYVNMFRTTKNSKISVADIIVNPETTDNIAALVKSDSNTPKVPEAVGFKGLTDTSYHGCFVPQPLDKMKRIRITLGADYPIAMIHVVNHPDYLDHLIDIKISVGVTNLYPDSTLCVDGLQNMAGIHSASFFCEPRITGGYVFIHQERADKQMSICEVGVFEETKPKVMDVKTKRFLWRKEGSDLSLFCDAKGYPAPVITWIKDKKVLQSGSSTLQLNNLRVNQSGIYECWANNTHGVDGRLFQLDMSSDLRVCTKVSEIEHRIGQPNVDIELNGNQWYRFYDPQAMKELEFFKNAPPKHISSCQVWLNGGHPKVHHGVVSRTLCVRDQTGDCSSTIDVYVRRCASFYLYNFKNKTPSSLTFCMKNVLDVYSGIHPAIASPVRNHALSQNVFHTEEKLGNSYECLIMCQLEPQCKSFNFSYKLQICELNSATKKEFPNDYGYSVDYAYYHMGSGMVKAAKQDL